MKTLPTTDRELNAIVFKGAKVSEPRSINDYFNMQEIEWMLNNGSFTVATHHWLYMALDTEYVKLGY